jgi:CheY-like chemotaxis protein
MRLLIVEDDQTMRSLLKMLLELEGFSVDVVNVITQSSIEDSIKANQPAVILMDVHLQKINGIDLLISLKAKYPAIKFIMSSGMDMQPECTRAGADHFIMKPYMPEDLIQLLKSYAA